MEFFDANLAHLVARDDVPQCNVVLLLSLFLPAELRAVRRNLPRLAAAENCENLGEQIVQVPTHEWMAAENLQKKFFHIFLPYSLPSKNFQFQSLRKFDF